jgi:DNA-directed RNA polymerase specialized sigma subunit
MSQNNAMRLTEEFIAEYEIHDEDLEQELYLRACEMIGSWYNAARFTQQLKKRTEQYYQNRIAKISKVVYIKENDLIVDHFANMARNESDREMLREAFNTLTKRELKVISENFGFDDDPKSLSQIAREMNLSPTMVRNIKNRAICKMKLVCHNVISKAM